MSVSVSIQRQPQQRHDVDHSAMMTADDDPFSFIPHLEVDDEDEDETMEDRASQRSMDDVQHGGCGDVRARTVFRAPRSDNDTENSTRSLYDTDVVYSYIHGRRYCGDYFMPNDEDEQTRQQILHGVYLHYFNDRLTTVPLRNPSKILDIGCGTGEWAMAMGDEYPEAEIIGTDIAKIQPSAVPMNVFFEIDDAEEEDGWTYNEDEFDLVHFRSMSGAFLGWDHIYREAYRSLKPGGWIEVLDFDDHKALIGYFDEETGVPAWLRDVYEGLRRSRRPRSSNHLEPEVLISHGFVDVKTTTYDLPIGTWPNDPELQKVAKHFLVAQLCGVEALSLRPLVEHMGYDIERVRQTCARVTESVKAVATDPEKAQGIGFKIKVVVGRKPDPRERLLSPGARHVETDGDSVNTVRQGAAGQWELKIRR